MEDHRLLPPIHQGNALKTLFLFLDSTALPRFDYLLQAGFIVRAVTQRTIRAYLSEQLGLGNRYINDRITTVFLDGKPVDNIDSAIIREGSTIALSSAMPGLAGASMRRGGYYSVFRKTITYNEPGDHKQQKEGFLRIKLFNLLLPQLGPIFLERGIYLRTLELTAFLLGQPFSFFEALRKATLEGEPLEIPSLTRPGWSGGEGWIRLVAVAQNHDGAGKD